MAEYVSDKSEEAEGKENHSGNTGLPFGLCKKYGIPLSENATPRDAWEALKRGTGLTPDEIYSRLSSGKELPQKLPAQAREITRLSENEVENNSQNVLTSNKPFVPAKTIEEATNFAKRFNVEADYSKFSVEVANAVNQTIQQVADIFGEKALRALKLITAYDSKSSNNKYASGGFDSFTGKMRLRNVGKNGLQRMKASNERAIKLYGDTYYTDNSEFGVIRHELGHAVHSAAGVDWVNKDIISYIRKRKDNKDYTNDLDEVSWYADKSMEEYVAECVAEYLKGNPRRTARDVVEILKKHL